MAKSNKKTTTPAVEPAVTPAVTPTVDAPATTSLEPVQLTVADLQLLGRIVDLASRRGAFQAGELSQVGDAYNKLTSFLAYVERVQEKEKEETATPAQETATA